MEFPSTRFVFVGNGQPVIKNIGDLFIDGGVGIPYADNIYIVGFVRSVIEPNIAL
jgi:hypothetical protein